MKKIILFLVIVILLLVNPVFSWIDCNPTCNTYYTNGSILCPSPGDETLCYTACTRTANCYGSWTQIETDTDYDIDYSDDRAETEYDFDADNENGACSGTSCYTDYCYKMDMAITSTAYMDGYEEDQVSINLHCYMNEGITEFDSYDDIIDDDDTVYMDGDDEAEDDDAAYIYPYNYGSTSSDQGYFTDTDGFEGINCDATASVTVDEITNFFAWTVYSKVWYDADAYNSTCQRTNEAPVLENCPDAQIEEDGSGSSISIDLWACHDDPDGSDSDSTFTIDRESNSDLIDCYIYSDRYLKCYNPAEDEHGYSLITLTATDEYSNSDDDEIRINVTSVPDIPNATDVQVLPLSPTLGDDLICDYNFSNPKEKLDEQGSTYEWWKNDANQNINSQVLDKGNLSLNDEWYCKVTPSDGLSNGTKMQSTNTVTISNTVQDPSLYVNDEECWNNPNYYSDKSVVKDVSSQLNGFLTECQKYNEGYCDIPLTLFSDSNGNINISDIEIFYTEKEVSLAIDSLDIVYNNGVYTIFEFIILNDGESTVTDIHWTFEPGDETTIESTTNITSLAVGEEAYVYVEYNYANTGSYITTANATGISQSTTTKTYSTSNIDIGVIDVYDLEEIYSDNTISSFEFKVNNTGSTNLTGINWSLDTGLTTISSNNEFNLTSGETIFVLTEYNYTQTGDYTVEATATDGTSIDSETISIDVPDIELANLTIIDSDNTERTFEAIIENSLTTNLSAVDWTLDTGLSTITANDLVNLIPDEKLYIIIDYNYTQTGTYTVNATAINGSLKDSKDIEITI